VLDSQVAAKEARKAAEREAERCGPLRGALGACAAAPPPPARGGSQVGPGACHPQGVRGHDPGRGQCCVRGARQLTGSQARVEQGGAGLPGGSPGGGGVLWGMQPAGAHLAAPSRRAPTDQPTRRLTQHTCCPGRQPGPARAGGSPRATTAPRRLRTQPSNAACPHNRTGQAHRARVRPQPPGSPAQRLASSGGRRRPALRRILAAEARGRGPRSECWRVRGAAAPVWSAAAPAPG
jgi:hypothetical protein